MQYEEDYRLVDMVLGYFAEKGMMTACPVCGSDSFSVSQQTKRYGISKTQEFCVTKIICNRCSHLRSYCDIYSCEDLTL